MADLEADVLEHLWHVIDELRAIGKCGTPAGNEWSAVAVSHTCPSAIDEEPTNLRGGLHRM